MKIIATLLLSLLSFSNNLMAGPHEREMKKGTVLNYTVKEGSVSYKLKATVMVWNPELHVQVQWQTSGAKVIKGLSIFRYASLEYATRIKVKLKAGNEDLTAAIRWFGSFDIYDNLGNAGIDADVEIDDKKTTLTPGDETTKEILFNKVKTEMNYAEATANDAGKRIMVGFVEYSQNVILLSNYSNGTFSMNLVSIEAPVSAAEKLAKEILDGLAPKSKVPLKKMEPGRFTKIKSKYPLLATIEDYEPTNGGKIKKPSTKTYEYRYGSSSPNPPSLIDCFTADLKIIFNQSSNFGIYDIGNVEGRSLSSKAAASLMNVYVTKDYNSIPGFRPWTHWSFVRSLTESQRSQLAKEAEGYVAEYGFIS